MKQDEIIMYTVIPVVGLITALFLGKKINQTKPEETLKINQTKPEDTLKISQKKMREALLSEDPEKIAQSRKELSKSQKNVLSSSLKRYSNRGTGRKVNKKTKKRKQK